MLLPIHFFDHRLWLDQWSSHLPKEKGWIILRCYNPCLIRIEFSGWPTLFRLHWGRPIREVAYTVTYILTSWMIKADLVWKGKKFVDWICFLVNENFQSCFEVKWYFLTPITRSAVRVTKETLAKTSIDAVISLVAFLWPSVLYPIEGAAKPDKSSGRKPRVCGRNASRTLG